MWPKTRKKLNKVTKFCLTSASQENSFFFFLVQLFSRTPGLIYHSLNLQIYTLTQFSSWFPSVSCLHHFCQSTSGLVISKQVLGLVTELWLPQERLSSWGGQEHWTERVRLFYILETEWREWSQKSMTEADKQHILSTAQPEVITSSSYVISSMVEMVMDLSSQHYFLDPDINQS